ncbi:class I adenylate-forming enzyme family protein [Streptacidiphilus sp. P02-A3a]|uniref:class I adenylate-forming enzyme family protein n=1 Tax=Streptacidiphilus sp. P02-A3a TaxID=2704468 RepID=UPI0015FA5A1B|nr:class I adenylate-forming enzyme family protein [Streptacidiphilus sp. P02-A3a]QMU71155.1 acyl--CoA ligase [Streptacidiphilus sp. P02-A3a]
MSGAWPTGLPTTLDYPPAGIGAALAGSARRYRDRLAFVDGERSLTYTELFDRSLRLARGLAERGVKPGDTVGLLLPNSLWFPVGYFGAILAGAVVGPLNPAQPAGALREQLAEASVGCVVTVPECLPLLDQAAGPRLRLTVVVPGPLESARPDTVGLDELLRAEPATDAGRGGADLAHLAFTGGTTGRSKPVRVLHRNVMANALQSACWRSGAVPELDAEGGVVLRTLPGARGAHSVQPGQGVGIAVAPMFHAMGIISLVVSVLQGATVVLCGRFEPSGYLDLVQRHRANGLVGSPPMFRALLEHPSARGRDLGSVTLVSCGAAPIDRVTLERLHGLFPNALVAEGYGLTEATMAITLGPVGPTTPPPPPGTVGLPAFDTEVQIRTPDGDGGPLPTGELGEVWARGPQITDGYHGHPELTDNQFQGGWLRTGDLGRLDADGYLFLEGRAKDMLIYKGYNVYPQHLEEVLCTHPAVAQASVVGVPSEGVGEIPVGYVVPRAGVGADEAELLAFVAERVVPYARLRGLRLVDALPVSAAGKVLKQRLREEWRE